MDTTTIDFDLVVVLFLRLLIGIGPKIALVPPPRGHRGPGCDHEGPCDSKDVDHGNRMAVVLVRSVSY